MNPTKEQIVPSGFGAGDPNDKPAEPTPEPETE